MNSWQNWLTLNYKTISMWAKRWSPQDWRELLTHMSFYLQKNWIKFAAIPEEDKIKFLQAWMKNQVNWWNSEFNRSLQVNNLTDEYNLPDVEFDDFIEIRAEVYREDIKEWLIDLHNNWTDEQIKILVKVRRIYLELPSHQKVLYDLYFTQMMSLRDIGKKLDLPLSAVYNMILELKKIIQDKC
jgi:hypothetical protein